MNTFKLYKENLINNLQELIKIPSVYEESKNPKEPFGPNTIKALSYVLDLGEKLGFRTKNIDGYCGYIEFGNKSGKLIGIIGHLDVVPEGENWTYPAFDAQIHDNKIYGRGAIDDKGPVMASLYAMKSVMDYCNENQIIITKRVRLILGLNEERSWNCIEYYKKHEEMPIISFSPDADFPCIYAEKGIISPFLIMDYSKYKTNDIAINKIDCKNNPLNVVPKYCSCNISISNNLSTSEVERELKIIVKNNKFNIDIKKLNNNEIQLVSNGVQSHAAHPDDGINAISRLIIVLDKLLKKHNTIIPLFDFFTKYIGLDYNGNKLRINIPDESGELTLNVAQIYFKENTLKIGLNLRIPINTNFNFIETRFTNICRDYNVYCEFTDKKEPLHVPKNSYLVKTLCEIYNSCTNSNAKPLAIGGATYARAFKNCISFGANLPGQKDMCHQTDEYISIDNLLLAHKIYCEAIYTLINDEL